jgi:D-alanyl-D-alanine carboxypeptidase
MSDLLKRNMLLMRVSAILAILGLVGVGWLSVVAWLTHEQDRACEKTNPMSAQDDPFARKLQRRLEDFSASRNHIGLQASVIFPDGRIKSAVAGYASHEKKCPLTPAHHLYIGSITKMFTSAMVMQQVERGTLSLDDTLDRWMNLPNAQSVTIRMLLNHTSSIPDYAWEPWFIIRWFGLPKKEWRADDLIAVIRNQPSRFAPGARHEYSNSNYVLLGAILERMTGKEYAALLKEDVFDRLNLRESYFRNYPRDLAIANAYDESLLRLGRQNLTGFRSSFETGAFSAGGILSTSPDVARFVLALFSGKIVSERTLAQMKMLVAAPDEDLRMQTGYGLGIRNLSIGGQNWIGHTGTIPGYSGIAVYNQETPHTIVILSNLSTIDQVLLVEEILRIMTEE